jgi:N-methylhydantoinase A
VYQRDDLQSGDRIDGPAVIIERETSTVVINRYHATRQPDGCLLLTQKGKD